MNATIDVSVDIVNASADKQIPAASDFRDWTRAALAALQATGQSELCIRVVDEEESAQLNTGFRQKNGPTNILSFPGPGTQDGAWNMLGDLAICAPLVRREAIEQNKSVNAHWAHLTVHGVLHLNGYDHEETSAAQQMESLEIRILDTLGFGNPYHENEDSNE